jgi:hypothetical protein
MDAGSLKFLGFAEQHSPQATKAQETKRPRRVAYFATWNAKNLEGVELPARKLAWHFGSRWASVHRIPQMKTNNERRQSRRKE